MFTAVVVTRMIFETGIKMGWIKELRMFHLFEKPNFDWMKFARFAFVSTAILATAGIIAFLARGDEKYDIEFVGGTQVELALKPKAGEASVPIKIVREKTDEVLGSGATVQELEYAVETVGESKLSRFLISVPATGGKVNGEENVKAAIAKAFESMRPEGSTETVQVAPTEITEEMIRERLLKALPAKPTPAAASAAPAEVRYIPREMRQYLGKILLTVDLTPPLSLGEVQRRVDTLLRDRFPELAGAVAKVEGKAPADTPGEFKSVELWVRDDYAGRHIETPSPQFWGDVIRMALAKQETFASVTSFEPTMAREAWNKAVIAILLSLSLMAVYIWFRFAKFSSGIAAVVATVHDVLIALGAVSVAVYVAQYVPWLAGPLMLTDMKVNLPLIGAFLTLVGYSVNDTIVVFDRIRENRGKYGDLSTTIINNSINQTLSRTVLTSSTVFVAVVALYFFGGRTSSIHGLAFVMLIGTFVGCYSSVAIASPILVMGDYLRKVYAWSYPVISVALLAYYALVWSPPWEGGFFASPAGWIWAVLQLAWTYLVWDACHNLSYGRPWGLFVKAPAAAKVVAGISLAAAPAAVVLGMAVLGQGSGMPAWAGPAAVLALSTCPATYAMARTAWRRTEQKN
jgi:SecD/SecF fusion protein